MVSRESAVKNGTGACSVSEDTLSSASPSALIGASARLIEVRVRDLRQLFNSMDPSPFHEKDLDATAEEFITSWAMEYPLEQALVLAVYVDEPPTETDPEPIVAEAVHHFYSYRSDMKRRELRELLRRGRTSLFIGLFFLTACLLASRVVESLGQTTLIGIVSESFIIGGWVAMWRPLEIFLYDWWPVRHMRRVYDKLSRMEVRVSLAR